MRYYSVHRPISPGTFPRQEGNAVVEIHNYDYRKFVKQIGREAWGWIEYEEPLDELMAEIYELVQA